MLYAQIRFVFFPKFYFLEKLSNVFPITAVNDSWKMPEETNKSKTNIGLHEGRKIYNIGKNILDSFVKILWL